MIGAGAAGLRAAIEASTSGCEVICVGKGSAGETSCTVMSGGVLRGAGTSKDVHKEETLKAGRGLNHLELVEVLVEEAPMRLRELLEWGLKGEIKGNFLFSLGRAPVWGRPLSQCLVQRAKAVGVRLLGSTTILQISHNSGVWRACGFTGQDSSPITISSRSLVLATGGAAALYERHDNPQIMLGQGIAMALKAGACLRDMEFVQFYPLGLAEKGLPTILIPPRLGDAARLLNTRGEEILEKYDIQERPAAEKARDRLSRAMFMELAEGQELWLDLRNLTQEEWMRDPLSRSCVELLRSKCGDLQRPLRVAPMAHFLMGGVVIDASCATGVPGLFGAGEVTGGLHGANRLGGNGLTEAIVFGARAGRSAALWAKSSKAGLQGDKGPWVGAQCRQDGLRIGRVPRRESREFLKRLRDIMWRGGCVIRDPGGLEWARGEVEACLAEAQEHSGDGSSWWMQEVVLACRTALAILGSALRRGESRGAHFRVDFPSQDDLNYRGYFLVRQDEEGNLSWRFEPLAGGGARG